MSNGQRIENLSLKRNHVAPSVNGETPQVRPLLVGVCFLYDNTPDTDATPGTHPPGRGGMKKLAPRQEGWPGPRQPPVLAGSPQPRI